MWAFKQLPQNAIKKPGRATRRKKKPELIRFAKVLDLGEIILKLKKKLCREWTVFCVLTSTR